MKKFALTLISTVMALGVGHAQNQEGLIAQPTHIVGKRINANGEVTSTIESDFTYYENGKPHKFTIPDYELSTTYKFEDEFFIRERTKHASGYPELWETLEYTYENGKVKTIKHSWSHGYDYPEYWEYNYGADGRLARKDYLNGIPEVQEFHDHYLYEYENDGKTKIENYWTSWEPEGMKLRKTTVYQYDDEYKLSTRLIESYDLTGALTSSTFTNYSYSSSGKLDTRITQTLTNGEWVNSSIMHYVYDDTDRVVEQQNGVWSAENGDWNINKKVVFELSEDGATYTVSFYVKNTDEEWVWSVFNNQTIFFGSALANQQRTMRFYQREEYNGMGSINQFEISLIYTEEPVYMNTEENRQAECCVYPNPGRNNLNVKALTENAVVRFYNLQGQLMIARPFDFSTEINTEGWPVGIYLWEIWNDNQKEAAGKWVKE